MVQGEPGRRALGPSHNVARYCRPRDVRDDGAVSPAAFELRPGEAYLSTNWLEYFHDSDRPTQIAGVRQALTDKGFQVRRAARFAVLNVGVAVAACSDQLNLAIQFVVLGESHDPSHTGIYGYTASHALAAAALAESVSPNEIHPAA